MSIPKLPRDLELSSQLIFTSNIVESTMDIIKSFLCILL
jgi:hypothetical protein